MSSTPGSKSPSVPDHPVDHASPAWTTTRRGPGTLLRVPRWARAAIPRLAPIAIRVAFGVLLLYVLLLVVAWITSPYGLGPWAPYPVDRDTYIQAVQRWLAGGSFYQPYQLTGPYTVYRLEVLYPPTIIPLLAVMSVLPSYFWWAVPVGIVASVVLYMRPTLIGWTLILACLAVPTTFEILAFGNPTMWITAFVALGTVWGWPGVLVAVKPTLAPFMLIGVRRRTWWLAAALLLLVSVAFLPMWFEYATVLLNARGPMVSPFYSVKDLPMVLIPIAAWVTRASVRASSSAGGETSSMWTPTRDVGGDPADQHEFDEQERRARQEEPDLAAAK